MAIIIDFLKETVHSILFHIDRFYSQYILLIVKYIISLDFFKIALDEMGEEKFESNCWCLKEQNELCCFSPETSIFMIRKIS